MSERDELDSQRRAQPVEQGVVERWRHAHPAEHGRTLWGLLEFADLVREGRQSAPPPEPLLRLPTPLSERSDG